MTITPEKKVDQREVMRQEIADVAALRVQRIERLGLVIENICDPTTAHEYIKLLGLDTVAGLVRYGETAPGESIPISASLREALSTSIARGVDRLAVADDQGQRVGVIAVSDITKPQR
jgi:CBS domain-containing protein